MFLYAARTNTSCCSTKPLVMCHLIISSRGDKKTSTSAGHRIFSTEGSAALLGHCSTHQQHMKRIAVPVSAVWVLPLNSWFASLISPHHSHFDVHSYREQTHCPANSVCPVQTPPLFTKHIDSSFQNWGVSALLYHSSGAKDCWWLRWRDATPQHNHPMQQPLWHPGQYPLSTQDFLLGYCLSLFRGGGGRGRRETRAVCL